MFNQELTPEESQKKILELEKKVEALESMFSGSKLHNNGYVDRLLDNQSKDILKQNLSSRILDEVWKTSSYYHLPFDANDGYTLTTSGTGTGDIDSTGAVLGTGATSGGSGLVQKETSIDFMSWDRRIRMRTGVTIDEDTSQNIYIVMGSITDSHVGFFIENGSVYGETRNSAGTVRRKLLGTLGSITSDEFIELELDYRPGAQVSFRIDGKEVGTLSTTDTFQETYTTIILPPFEAKITNTANVSRILGISYVSFLSELWQNS